MFQTYMCVNHERPVLEYDKKDISPMVIENSESLYLLCPINPTTGLREPLDAALRRAVADPRLSQLVAPFLQELPEIKSDPRLTDDDRFDLMIDRFSIGTPAENDRVRESLAPFADLLFRKSSTSAEPGVESVANSSADSGADSGAASA